MGETARNVMRQVWLQARTWAQPHIRACHQCRECQGIVSPLEIVCPHCGASAPVRIPMTAGLVVTAFGVSVVLLLCF
jgi:hypothetical protein